MAERCAGLIFVIANRLCRANKAGPASPAGAQTGARSFLEQAAQHPGGLFVHFQALRSAGRPSADRSRSFTSGNSRAQCAPWLPVPLDQMTHHVVRIGARLDLLDRGQFDELLVGSGRRVASARMRSAIRSSAFHCSVYCPMNIRCRRVELRPGDVPVEVVRHQVERVAVGEQGGSPCAIFLRSPALMPMSIVGDLAFFAFMIGSP